MPLRYWLMKSEPASYSWDDLVHDGETIWDGVRNHRASNNMRAMQAGEQVFFYHSVTDKAIFGIAEVSAPGLTDPKDPDHKWAAVKIRPVKALARRVGLAEIKREPTLADIELIRLSRLSVAEISPDEWARICSMAEA